MSGRRLVIGFVAMGIAVPAILFFFLPLESVTQFLVAAVVCFLGWGIADLGADILARPRLKNRSPQDAIREIEMAEETRPGGRKSS